jgi:TM2 domain-containing membrane protein YozV
MTTTQTVQTTNPPQSQNESIYARLKNHLPVLHKTVAIIILIFNIFFPGVGTMMLSCIGGTFKIEHVWIGLVQFFTSICVFGWVWSVLWGIILVMKSKE